MGENVWCFRKRLTLLFGSAVIIAVVFFIFKVLFYYVWPFMLAFCFAVLLQKPIVGLAKLLREKKTLAASIVVTMVTLIILSVLLYVGYMAFRELKDFIANFDENINSLDGQFKLVCCRIDGWIKLKEGCSYAFLEKCKGIIIDGDGQQMFFTIMRKHSVPVITCGTSQFDKCIFQGAAYYNVDKYCGVFNSIFNDRQSICYSSWCADWDY